MDDVHAEGEIISLQDREHLLLRPDTLCGSTKPMDQKVHVFTFQSAVTAPVSMPVTAPVSTPVTAPAVQDVLVQDGSSAMATPVATVRQFSVETKQLSFAPAVKNLFQEILTNALDRQYRDPKMKRIDVWIGHDEAGGANWIRVKNDGQGLPVIFDEERGAWKPTIAFSHFRSGTNFQDDAAHARWTAGRNGYGCKATNVFSLSFTVETADPVRGLMFSQTFTDNMAHASEPVIKPFSLKKGFTNVSFLLDYARLGVPNGSMTPDIKQMLVSTVVDATCLLTKKVVLSLDGTLLDVKNVKHFTALFLAPGQPTTLVASDVVKSTSTAVDVNTWEVCVAPVSNAFVSSDDNVVGFVNSLQCSQGTHVNLALSRLTSALEDHIRLKNKKAADFKLSPAHVRRNVFIVVKLMVDSPEFSSQTKEKLTTPCSSFDADWHPSAAFIKTLVASGVVESIYQEVVDKELSVARRLQKKASSSGSAGNARRNVIADKYDPATNVMKHGSTCSLLVTEGDSARALAVAGLAVVGRANFGIFALKGKPLNVRNLNSAAISKNKEVMTLLNIIGLTYGQTYTSLAGLNYKKLVIFSDQDPDGAHIGGLIINVIHALFPSVLKVDPAFVQRFATPLVRVTEKGKSRGDVRCFYARPHFEEWWEHEVAAATSATASAAARMSVKYDIKYYKGLGTSTSALAREYFSSYRDQLVDIVWTAASDELMVQMFQSDNASSRRDLLTQSYDPAAYIDYTSSEVSLPDFIYKEVLPYSNYSNERNIPNVIDGLKPVQRKALFTFLSKNIVADVKVAQVAAQVAAFTMYHHGEQSLVETIVGMAQDHVGVSNINVFRPEGQFGSRLDAPSVHSAARYIFTGLDAVTRFLFPDTDDAVLSYKLEEGSRIEPEFFVPVIPMALVNGAFGIGTGWSTSVPLFSPQDLIRVCQAVARDGVPGCEQFTRHLTPWYHGFTGEVTFVPHKNTFLTRGVMTVSEDGRSIHITELPVGTWTHPFVEQLEHKWMINGNGSGSGNAVVPKKRGREKFMSRSRSRSPSVAGAMQKPAASQEPFDDPNAGFIFSIERRWTESKVDMILHCDGFKVLRLISSGMQSSPLWAMLGMQSELRLNNMHLHDASGKLRRYESVTDIVAEHAAVRLALYEKRRLYMIAEAEKDRVVTENKLRFVEDIVSGRLTLAQLPDDDAVVRHLEEHGFAKMPDFGYLLNMSFRSLNQSRVSRLRSDIDQLTVKIQTLTSQTPSDLWLADLSSLEEGVRAFYVRREKRYECTLEPEVTTAKRAKKTRTKT